MDDELEPWIQDLLRGAPFRRVDDNPDVVELVKLAVSTITIVPLRLVGILLSLIVTYVCIMTLLFAQDIMNWLPQRNSSTPRASIGLLDSTINWVIQTCAQSILVLMGFQKVNVRGSANMKHALQVMEKRPIIIVANHLSFIEILYLLSTPLCPCFVFKQSCLDIPIISTMAVRALHCVAVDNKRTTASANGQGSNGILNRVEALRKGEIFRRPIAIFPEGTTSNGDYLLRFRTGAFVPGCDVLPIVARMPFVSFSPAYESILTPVHIIRTLSQWNNNLEIQFLPLYSPSAEERDDPRKFADNVRDIMAEEGKLIKAPMGFQDKLRYHSHLRELYKSLGWTSYLYPRPDLVGSNKAKAFKRIYSSVREEEIIRDCKTGG